jgi:hypothetical protein
MRRLQLRQCHKGLAAYCAATESSPSINLARSIAAPTANAIALTLSIARPGLQFVRRLAIVKQ